MGEYDQENHTSRQNDWQYFMAIDGLLNSVFKSYVYLEFCEERPN